LKDLTKDQDGLQRGNAPVSITLPSPGITSWLDTAQSPGVANTPKANGGLAPLTPGLAIGVATPAVTHPLPGYLGDPLPTTNEEKSDTSRLSADYNRDNRSSPRSSPRSSSDRKRSTERKRPSFERAGEKALDYFSTSARPPPPANVTQTTSPVTPGGTIIDGPGDGEKETAQKESTSLFGKKFRMNFGSKKIGRSTSTATKAPTATDEKAEESDASKTSDVQDVFEENLGGVVQRFRKGYVAAAKDGEDPIPSAIQPSLPNETPVLKPAPLTTVIIQEDRPDSGGVADLYRGTVASLGEDADLIEKVAPTWLGDMLLLVSFVYYHVQCVATYISAESDTHQGNGQSPFRAAVLWGATPRNSIYW
jgi:WD repeat-containing protein 48